ncbi:MAG: DDE-type integrase/transposase/recombinase, partial [Piscirickettsiaceae bacterium]|nr:DDE-type integrase/transposase/recombinase [Piscirickettsiaceae bacterium]
HYLCQAINNRGETLDLYPPPKHNNYESYQFLKHCLSYYKKDRQPKILNTDKHTSYAHTIACLKNKVRMRKDIKQRQIKYLNNGIESDHAPIKKLISTGRGVRVLKITWSTIQGCESLKMLNKRQFDFWLRRDERKTLVRERSAFINLLCNVETVFT